MTLVITRALGLVTLQDLGRPGHMHEALPRGGALVRSWLVAANQSLGNAAGAAAIEILGTFSVRAEASVVVAMRDGSPRVLRAGEELAVTSEPYRAAYLAVAGGIAAPLLLGGRGAHLSAGLGRPLRAGDRLSPAGSSVTAWSAESASASLLDGDAIRVLPGPDPEAFEPSALASLISAPFKLLPTSDRVGTRLSGPPLARRPSHRDRSRPMVLGALEVPPDGSPIVLGPEHPTTGGYPILAVITHADLDTFFSIRLGGTTRFTLR